MTHNYIVDIRDGNLTTIQSMITTAVEADNKHNFDEYAISLAVRFGQTAIFNYLVTLGANLDLVSDNSFSAIHWAAVNNDNTMLASLISNGANVETKQKTSLNSSLHLSVARNYDTITQTLLNANANVDVANACFYTPIHLCVKKGYSTMTQTLIDASANLNPKDNIGNTPLHLSVIGDYTVIAQKLLDGGADKTITNDETLTPANMPECSAAMTIVLA